MRGSGVSTSVVCVPTYGAARHFLDRTGDFVGRTGGDPCIAIVEVDEPDDLAEDYISGLRMRSGNPLPAIVLCDACPVERMRSLYTVGVNSILVMPSELHQYQDWLVATLHYWIRLNCTRIMLT